MMEKQINISEYKSFKYNYIKTKIIVIKIIIVFLIITCIFLNTIKFDIIYSNKYIVIKENNEILLNTNILEKDINKVYNNKYIYIDNKKYKYKIIKIDNIIDNNIMLEYKNIYIKLDKNKYKIDNSIINGQIIYDNKNCFKIIYDLIFEGE